MIPTLLWTNPDTTHDFDTQDVTIPTGYKYDISGNNVDGFIVTVHKDEKVAIEQEKPTEAAETTTESETTEEETENTEE